MHLKEESRPERDYRPYIVPELDADELVEDEETSIADLAGSEQADAVIEVNAPADENEPTTEEPPSSQEEAELSNASAEIATQEPDVSRTSETAAADAATAADPPQDEKTEKSPRKGRSRRRRSRKRSRRCGSQEDGN